MVEVGFAGRLLVVILGDLEKIVQVAEKLVAVALRERMGLQAPVM